MLKVWDWMGWMKISELTSANNYDNIINMCVSSCVYYPICVMSYVEDSVSLFISLFPEVKSVSVKSSPLPHLLVPISATTTMASWEVNRHHVNA